MSKKTALELACEKYYYTMCETELCISCPAFFDYCVEHCPSDKTCIKRIKQHFQQTADIPDGWEVVKEIYKKVDKFVKERGLSSCGEDAYWKRRILKDLLQQEGIKVE